MTEALMNRIKAQLVRHEGLRLKPYRALESRLHLIGSVIDAGSRKEKLVQQIYDKGDFYGNTGYLLQTTDTAMILRVGSNMIHEPFAITLNPLHAKSSGNPICPPSPAKCLP